MCIHSYGLIHPHLGRRFHDVHCSGGISRLRTDYSEHNQAVLARQASRLDRLMSPTCPDRQVVFTTHQPVPLTPHAAAARANTVVRKREVNAPMRGAAPPLDCAHAATALIAASINTSVRLTASLVDGEPRAVSCASAQIVVSVTSQVQCGRRSMRMPGCAGRGGNQHQRLPGSPACRLALRQRHWRRMQPSRGRSQSVPLSP